MRIFYILIAMVIGSCLLHSCNVINPKEPTPTYVHIDSFQFAPTNYLSQGTSSHKITCIWAYYNNEPVGVFDLPATFPVITTGNSGQLTIIPGITVDGLSAYQTQYPFYSTDTSTLTTAPGKIINYLPKTGYNPGTNFVYFENFDISNGFQNIAGDSIVITTDPTKRFEGGSGYINMPNPGDSSENIFLTKKPFVTAPGYVELNYKNSVPFFIGVFVVDVTGNTILTPTPDYILGINSSSTWNKVYVSLVTPSSQYLSLFPGSQFRLAIKTIVPDTSKSGYVLLDNIKYITK